MPVYSMLTVIIKPFDNHGRMIWGWVPAEIAGQLLLQLPLSIS
ncbi:hypothetical protein [Flavobacterium reichenbachii]|nr:hypothetical protein [Flavobacterium reichenbachii]